MTFSATIVRILCIKNAYVGMIFGFHRLCYSDVPLYSDYVTRYGEVFQFNHAPTCVFYRLTVDVHSCKLTSPDVGDCALAILIMH